MDITRRELLTRLFSRQTIRQIVPLAGEMPSLLEAPPTPLDVEAAGRSLRRRSAPPAAPPGGQQPPHKN